MSADPPGPQRMTATRIIWAVATLGVLATCVAVLLAHGTPPRALAIYLTWLLLGVVVPGTLVHTGVRGRQSGILADLTLGSATGLALNLVAWALASLLDVRATLVVWPLLSLTVLAFPGARRRLRTSGGAAPAPAPAWPAGPAALLAGALVVAVWQLATTYLSVHSLPPGGQPLYPDLLWHLGLAEEAARALPLGTPQVVGDGSLKYHWFAHAHLAATSLSTGIDLPTLLLRLWPLGLCVLTVLMTAVLTEKVSGRAWAAVGAAWLGLPTMTIPFWPAIVPRLEHINGRSPTQLFSYGVMLLTLHALVDLVRSGRLRGALPIALVGALAAAGAKASALPVVLGGMAAVTVFALATRARRAATLAMAGALLVITTGGLAFVSGGNSGSAVQLLSSLTVLRPYRVLVTQQPDFTTVVPSGLLDRSPLLLAGLLVATGIGAVRSLAWLAPIFQSRLRQDPAAWLLAGTCASALVPFLLLGHGGYSEYYFMYATVPVGCALWMWCLAELVVRRPRLRAASVAGLVAGALGSAVLTWLADPPAPTTAAAMEATLQTFLIQTGAVCAVGVLVWTAVRVRRGRAAGTAVAAVSIAALLSPLFSGAVLENVRQSRDAAVTPPAQSDPVVLSQNLAALWIREHVPRSALMATNAHCSSGVLPTCRSMRWWISGLGGRRVLVESWAYSPDSVGGAFADQPLLALNDRAFSDPSPANLEALRQKGVTWLVEERAAGAAYSPRLAELLPLKFRDASVSVYELASPGRSTP